MADIDPVSMNYFLKRKTGINFPLDCVPFEEVKNNLSENEIKTIMNDLGIYLSKLNKLEGKRSGLVEPRALDKGELIGDSDSWYEFWMDNFKLGFDAMDKQLKEEKKSKEYKTNLDNKNRKLMYNLLDQKDKFLSVLKSNEKLINSNPSRFLNANVYTKNITIRNGKFVGLTDFSKALLGDPVDEIAYFSVMPDGNIYLPFVLETWQKEINDNDFEEKMHLYRLLESYRKIITRYVKHHYLDEYPEPLVIAQEELAYYNIK